MLEKCNNALRANDDILFIMIYNEDFDKVTFIANQRHILFADLDNINLDNDDNFHEDNPDTFFMSDFWLGVVTLKNAKHLKKRESKN